MNLIKGTHMIMPCSQRCSSPYQDERYGKNMRVHNRGTKGTLKCTVCDHATQGPSAKKGDKAPAAAAPAK